MKKIIFVILAILCLLGALYMRGERLVRESMPADVLFVFSQKGCPHCQSALAFIDETVRPKYPNLKIEVLDVADQKNLLKLSVVAKQYKLRDIGTPILVLNGKALMGWPKKNEKVLLSIIDSLPTKKP